MKTIWKSLFVLALGAFAFSSCEDVPEPYQIPGQENNGGSNTPAEPAGDGTLDNPFNVAAVNEFIGKGEDLNKTIYIKGIVSSVKEISTSFGNGTFYISDDGSTKSQFYVYRCFSLDNKKFTSEEEVKPGDEVIICGQVTNYNGTYETVQNNAYIYSINGQGGTPSDPITGENLLVNGDLETWADAQPTNWKSASTASSATLSQSTDAHTGSYSVQVEGNETQNKRIAYKELTLKAGTYEFSFYAKATTADAAQCRPGYVAVTNGVVDGEYNYGGYTSINNTSWTQVSNTFTLNAETTVCLIIMNPKKSDYASGQNILIDDATLKTNDGGIIDNGGDTTPDTPNVGDAEHITIADFLSKADTGTNYELTGVVKNIVSTYYGNFDLVEGDASVYIYGLLDLNGADKNFASLGIAEGDEITVVGKYVDYNGKAEIVNAQFVKINKKGEGGSQEPETPENPDITIGSNILENGDFESWSGSTPTNWSTASSAGNATLSQSSDCHGGSSAVSVGFATGSNKRLGYKEMTLPAGTYVFSFYAKATTADGSQCQPGYTPITNGTAGSYNYLGYVDINNTSWTLVSKEFTLATETTICLVVMNPKTNVEKGIVAQNILIDDASLIKK